jgi:hypothetical protein
MHNVYVLLINVITIKEIRDCSPKHFCSLHFVPHVLPSCAGMGVGWLVVYVGK